MAQPPKKMNTAELLEDLENLSFTTYKSRLMAYERIQARAAAWNAALIALAAATTVASVGLLVDETMYGSSGEPMLVACAVLSLAASLAVSSKDYAGRAVRLENNYKELQALSFLVRAARSDDARPTLQEYESFISQYTDLLRHSENHITADWKRGTFRKAVSRFFNQRAVSATASKLPYATLVVPIWLLWRFTEWVLRGAS